MLPLMTGAAKEVTFSLQLELVSHIFELYCIFWFIFSFALANLYILQGMKSSDGC